MTNTLQDSVVTVYLHNDFFPEVTEGAVVTVGESRTPMKVVTISEDRRTVRLAPLKGEQ